MTDRRFAEQGDDLKNRARWDAEPGQDADELNSSALDQDSADPRWNAEDAADRESAVDGNLDGDVDGDFDSEVHGDVDGESAVGANAAVDRDDAVDADADDEAAVPAGLSSTPGIPDQRSASPVTSAPAPAPAPLASSTDGTTAEDEATLLPGEDADTLRARWQSIQAGFVDDPRQSVEEADGLLEQVAERFAQSLTDARSALRNGWDGNNGVAGSAADDAGTSTEELRGTLRNYRRLVNRLLEV
jgi:hypothetical protein